MTSPSVATGFTFHRRLRRLWADPLGESRLIPAIAWLYIIWSIVPVFIAVLFSFNPGRSLSAWQGFSLRWYVSDPNLSVLHNPSLREALFQSLRLAFLTMLIATPLGVLLAIGLTRWQGKGSRPANVLMLLPLVTPEIVMGVGLFLVFTSLFRPVQLGTSAQVLGHVTFSLPLVVVIVRARLLGIGPEYENAAMDLGASYWSALWRILLPMLAPAIFAGLMIAFAVSIDDFVISQFLASGQSSVTIPMLLYGGVRTSPTPALNALGSIMLFISLLAVAVAGLALRWRRHVGPGAGQPAIPSPAHLGV